VPIVEENPYIHNELLLWCIAVKKYQMMKHI